MSLNIFGFRALWSPYFILFVIALTVMYFYLIGPGRKHFKEAGDVSLKQRVYFVLAMVMLYISLGSPLDLFGHISFSGHMASMAILFLIVPPLLIFGIPVWGWNAFVHLPIVHPIMKFFTKPIISLVLFNTFFSLYHVPFIFDVIKTNAVYHAIVTSLIFVFAFFMYWPLLNQLPNWNQINGLKKIGYILGNSVLITPACGLIIFAGTPLFATYSNPDAWVQALSLCVPTDMLQGLSLTGPEMFTSMDLREDQQLGGIIMKIIQELVYGSFLAYVFYEWARKERENDQVDYSPEPIK
ncbi:cytochrome c oxidase assembly factor CtaG [Bacillus sp. FJAT-47783]|uniref:cytochrome c oxidase assembly factor CtaG n=1 Tax=Bacillus sp. FJAT-47783 TaxID=2922712 RepID=UPI001FABDA5D|nr:cytochrome c oxidase assembly factor CtaG [Bacillus sp. FJAT-47783]